MNRKQQIEMLLSYLTKYNQIGKLELGIEERIILKEVYSDIFKVTPNIGCESCILHYLNMLLSYYEREFPSSPDVPIVTVELPKMKNKS